MDSDPSRSSTPANDPSVPAARLLASTTDAPPDWLVLRLEDLAAVVAKYRQENRRPGQWIGLVTGISGLFAAALLAFVAEQQGWPDALGPVIFAGGWVVALASFVVVWRRERQLRVRHQLSCPACDVPLLDESLGRGGMSRADLAIATGNCPVCAANILAS